MKRTISQTKAPKEDRVFGSKVNKPGSASTSASASGIKLADKTINSIKSKLKEHNDKSSKEVPLNTAKAVVRRGMGAYSKSHRPTITDGKPNSRVAWGLARLNAFLYKIKNGHSKSRKYSQDNDLINELGYKVSKYNEGGNAEGRTGLKDKEFYSKSVRIKNLQIGKKIKEVQSAIRNKKKLVINKYGIDDSNWDNTDKDVIDLINLENQKIDLVKEKNYYTSKNINELENQGYQFVEKNYSVNKEVDYNYYTKEGKLQKLNTNQRIIAVGNKTYLQKIKEKKFSQEYDYTIEESKLNSKLWVLIEEWKGYYLKKGGLIAPNGKPSNLTPEQYKLVRTPQFKAWFGDWENDTDNASKVVDSNGEPKVMWHFSLQKFTEFDPSFESRWTNQRKENVSWFGGSNKVISYSEGKEGFLYQCFLNAKKPIVVDAKKYDDWDYYKDENGYKTYSIQRIKGKFVSTLGSVSWDGKKNENDGVIFYNAWDNVPLGMVVAIPNASQIKLADGTNTTFDSSNPDIRFQSGGNVKLGFIQKNETGYYWLYAINDKGNYYKEIDGDRRLFVVKDMAKRWGYKLVNPKTFNKYYNIPERVRMYEYAKGGNTTDENSETYKKWKSLVNMTYNELKKFYESKEGKEAGLSSKEADDLGIKSGRESARWIMKMKQTSKEDWTPTMWAWARRQISFISRMSGNKGPLYDEKGNKTRKHTSLLIWGHNPKK